MRTIVRLIGLWAGLTACGVVLAALIYRWAPVCRTPFMRAQSAVAGVDFARASQEWVPLSSISRQLPLAVVSSEDNLFMTHWGFSTKAIERAWKSNARGKHIHGGSTISQQTAKNVFLWNGRSWVRKALEVPLTLLIELVWGKERIMEVYLNVVEQGPGVFGAEAAARKYFHHSARRLTREEAALMAAVLPNPRRLKLAAPSPYVRKRQAQIAALMPKIGRVFPEK